MKKGWQKCLSYVVVLSLFTSVFLPYQALAIENSSKEEAISETNSEFKTEHKINNEPSIHNEINEEQNEGADESKVGQQVDSSQAESKEPTGEENVSDKNDSTSVDSSADSSYSSEDSSSIDSSELDSSSESSSEIDSSDSSSSTLDSSEVDSSEAETDEEFVSYKAQIVKDNYYFYTKPGSDDQLEQKESAKEYLNKIVLIENQQVINEIEWVLVSFEDNILGWIEKEATQEIDESNDFSMFSLQKATSEPTLMYSSHVQDKGWLNEVKDGETSGTTGLNKQMEAIKINLSGVDHLSIKYSAHVEDYGWMNWVNNNEIAGTVGKNKQMEAIKIELTGGQAEKFDIYYRVHSETYGWLDWAKNGEKAGTASLNKQMEAIEVLIQLKGTEAPGPTKQAYVESHPKPATKPDINYTAHVQDYGWMQTVKDGKTAGTVGKNKQLEGLKIYLTNQQDLAVQYSAHVEDHGWMSWTSNGELAGTVGESKQIEAVKIKLTGKSSKYFDIYYRIHSAEFGWQGWAKNGEEAGLEGYNLPAEAIEIKVVDKGQQVGGSEKVAFRKFTTPDITYATHVQDRGWISDVKDGATSGSVGKSKQVEAVKISLQNAPYDGNISYQAHVQDIGWQSYVSNGAVGGTVGKNKQVEAINIKLTGDMAKYYDVYYRTHIEDYGWLGWAKNGMNSGSEDLVKRVEAIEVKLVKKGKGVAVSEKEAFKEPIFVFVDPGHGGKDTGAVRNKAVEKNLNLSVGLKVQKLLKNKRYKVAMSRTTDTFPSLADRKNQANALGTDIFVSIHHNSNNGSSKGIETFYYNQKGNTKNPMANNVQRINSSKSLANAIQNELIRSTKAVNRKVKTANFHVVRETKMPAVLTELGFVDNPSEQLKLLNPAYQEKLAKAIVDGIDDYFGK